MAGLNAYAGRFVGNEFILPTRPTKQEKEEIKLSPSPEAKPVVEVAQTYTTSTSAPAKALKNFKINPRVLMFSVAMLFSVFLVLSTVSLFSQLNPLNAISNLESNVQRRIQINLSHPVNFVQPPFSLVVESRNLSSDITNVAGQSVAINLSFATVNPVNNSVAKWISTSKGPKAGSTVLAINTAAISTYLSSLAKSYSRPAINQVVIHHADGSMTIQTAGANGVSFSGVSQATSSLATQLLAAKGSTVTLSMKTIPFDTTSVNQP